MGLYYHESMINNNLIKENGYKELSGMGFNSVRLYLHYTFFENDADPFVYKNEGFNWLNQQILWGKKYGIRFILNMHYPQGGYQSQGNGMALWNNENQEQERLVSLWKEIARRYANNTSIIGYGILNEPYIPFVIDNETSINQWKTLAQLLVDEIREVDENHIIFIEKIIAAKDNYGVSRYELNEDSNFIQVNDNFNNIAYEFHYYLLHELFDIYEYQKDTLNPIYHYPNPNLAVSWDYIHYNIIRSTDSSFIFPVGQAQDGWQLMESDFLNISNDEVNILYISLVAERLGLGRALFNDIEVSLYDNNGSFIENIFSIDFNNEEHWDNIYTLDDPGFSQYSANEGMNGSGCMILSGGGNFMTVSSYSPIRLAARNGYSYRVKTTIKIENSNFETKVYPQIIQVHNEDSGPFTKESISKAFHYYKAVGQKFNAPLYCGEFGANHGAYNGLGGEEWVGDIIDVCKDKQIGFNYHHYHGYAYALYPNDHNELPDPNARVVSLANVFVDKLH